MIRLEFKHFNLTQNGPCAQTLVRMQPRFGRAEFLLKELINVLMSSRQLEPQNTAQHIFNFYFSINHSFQGYDILREIEL